MAEITKEGSNLVDITIGDKKYKVEIADTPEKQKKGLMGRKSLPSNQGMLFVYDEPQDMSYWMKDTSISLDIIFIDDDMEVVSVKQGQPMSEEPITENDVQYVLEVNINSGIEEGDQLVIEDSDDNEYSMHILFPDGSVQMNLRGGERIVSRRETKILIKKAKKADSLKTDGAYRALGRYIFKVLKRQDSREPEYVDSPKDKDNTSE